MMPGYFAKTNSK